jgi:predicted RNA-binding protein with PUA-like domain
MAYWLMKSEPDAYSWDDLNREGEGTWDGVRNHSAAIHLKTMRVGDQALFYHSNIGKEAVGIMTISAEAHPDPTEPEGTRWVAVKVRPLKPLTTPVPLTILKTDLRLAEMIMNKQNRLSVSPVRDEEWAVILQLADMA